MPYFSNARQSIPQCFLDKMEADKELETLKEANGHSRIVDFATYKKAHYMQVNARYACMEHIKKQRGGVGGGFA